MSTNKLKIGEFSRLCHVTPRALRHYEEIGLLVPEIIDRETGYRYYSIGQYQKMQGILSLKEMGYSLQEIHELYEEDCHFPDIGSLEEKILECEAEILKLKNRKNQLKAVLASRKKIRIMEQFYFEALPAITVASYRGKLSSYSELGRLCYETIGPEMARLGCACPEPGYCYTIEHGEYRPTDIDIEYCEQVKEK
ncbi:MAG: MerR family transcriptional regulator, partial [Candidatus Cryptobacteroides sp.]